MKMLNNKLDTHYPSVHASIGCANKKDGGNPFTLSNYL